jgi:hypothetical protein
VQRSIAWGDKAENRFIYTLGQAVFDWLSPFLWTLLIGCLFLGLWFEFCCTGMSRHFTWFLVFCPCHASIIREFSSTIILVKTAHMGRHRIQSKHFLNEI